MLDVELDFAKIQLFIQVFCPKMLDSELDFDGGPYAVGAKMLFMLRLRKRHHDTGAKIPLSRKIPVEETVLIPFGIELFLNDFGILCLVDVAERSDVLDIALSTRDDRTEDDK